MMVSIIIPVFQVSDYVEQCICSVMSQTYTNIECIIVDDSTRDDSIEKCERLIAEANLNLNDNDNQNENGGIRFRILHHEVNRGLSAARNTGIDAAIGEYIYFLDGDDEITPDCIEKLVSIAQEHPEAEMIQGNSVMIPNDKHTKIHLDRRIPKRLTTNDEIATYYLKHWIPTPAWNKLIKRTFLTNHRLYFKEGLIYEDMHWMFFVIKHLQQICFCNDVTYKYYMRKGSIMNATSHQLFAKSFLIIYEEILNHLTAGRERKELNGYVEGFCKHYMKYKGYEPDYKDLYQRYKQDTKRYGCCLSTVKLNLTEKMAAMPMGFNMLQGMKDIKTMING